MQIVLSETKTRVILSMYTKEMETKKAITENICHVKDRNTMMFYTSAWIHQPFIEDSCTLIIEAMLLETGHR